MAYQYTKGGALNEIPADKQEGQFPWRKHGKRLAARLSANRTPILVTAVGGWYMGTLLVGGFPAAIIGAAVCAVIGACAKV